MEGRHLFLAALAWLTSSEGPAQTLSPPMPWRVLCAGLPSTLTPTPQGERGRPPGGGWWVGREGGVFPDYPSASAKTMMKHCDQTVQERGEEGEGWGRSEEHTSELQSR